MPGLNGRGPFFRENYPRGFGPCRWAGDETTRGNWFPRGLRRMRMRCNRFFQGVFGAGQARWQPFEKDALHARKRLLEEELKAINERLNTVE